MPEAWVDYNENGVRDANEPYFDFNNDGSYTAADAKYNGVLCTPGAAICSAQKSIDVRSSQIIVFSSSSATISINGNAAIALPACVPASGITPATFTVTVVDVNGNAMPAGTQVRFSSDNGTITSSDTYIVPDTIGCRTNNPVTGAAYICPASSASATFMNIAVTMKSDATWTPGTPPAPNTCANSTPAGTFTVTVTSPKGLITTATKGITD